MRNEQEGQTNEQSRQNDKQQGQTNEQSRRNNEQENEMNLLFRRILGVDRLNELEIPEIINVNEQGEREIPRNIKSNFIKIIPVILVCGFIALYIVAIMMSVALKRLEDKNNDKIDAYCSRWHTVEYCKYFNWVEIDGYYVGQVETLLPALTGTTKCKKASCISLSAEKCYYLGDTPIFYNQKKCDKHKENYKILLTITWLIIPPIIIVSILVVIISIILDVDDIKHYYFIIAGNLVVSLTIVTAIFIIYYQHDNLSLM